MDAPVEANARPEPRLDVGRLGNSVVQRAAVKLLASAERPLTVLEVQTAIVDLLGHPVSKGQTSGSPIGTPAIDTSVPIR